MLKNRIIKNKYILILSITILSSCILLFKNIIIGDDINFHLSRILFVKDNILSKNLFSSLYNVYGWNYGEAFFYPDFFIYIPALLYLFTNNIVITYKVLLFVINLLTAVSIYYSIYSITKSKFNSSIISIIYVFLPYRLCTMYNRASLGESIAFIFFPLVISGFFQIINHNTDKWYILAIGLSGLMLSHVLSVVFIIVVLFILILINLKKLNKKILLGFLKAFLMTIFLTSFFVFPFIEQCVFSKFKFIYTGSDISLSNRTLNFFNIFTEYNQFLNKTSEYWKPSGIGIILTVSIIIFIINYKKLSKNTKTLYLVGIIISLCTTNIFPWKSLDNYLKIIQFPWRFIPISSLLLLFGFSSMIKDLKISTKKKNIFIFFVIIVSVIDIGLCYISLYKIRINNITKSVAWGEYLPVEFDEQKMLTKIKLPSYTIFKLKQNDLIVTSKKAIDYEIISKDNQYIINFKNNSKNNIIKAPIIYYRGYICYINGKKYVPFKSDDGLVGINLSDKNGTIIIKYEKTFIQVLSRVISLFSFIILILYISKKRKCEL